MDKSNIESKLSLMTGTWTLKKRKFLSQALILNYFFQGLLFQIELLLLFLSLSINSIA